MQPSWLDSSLDVPHTYHVGREQTRRCLPSLSLGHIDQGQLLGRGEHQLQLHHDLRWRRTRNVHPRPCPSGYPLGRYLYLREWTTERHRQHPDQEPKPFQIFDQRPKCHAHLLW